MGFGDFIVHFWGESPLQFLSLCCQLHVHKKKKKIKNTTCIKTVTLASCGTFIGNFILSRLFIMHFLLTCITIKTTVLTTCMLILMFMLMLQYWSKTVCCKSQFLIPV